MSKTTNPEALARIESVRFARAAALTARQDKALDRTVNLAGIGLTTYREQIDGGRFAYRIESRYTTGKTRHGLVEHSDLDYELITRSLEDAVRYASYHEVPKLVADYAASLPLAIIPTHTDLPVEFVEAVTA